MKKILIIVDSQISKRLLERMVESNTDKNYYDVVYVDENVLPSSKPSNFCFHKFDPTSVIKLDKLIRNSDHFEALIALSSKEETLDVIKTIRFSKRNFEITILDEWGIDVKEDPYLQKISSQDLLSSRMVQKLPNIPVIANNIGLGQGEIMEIRIPFGSSFAHRYLGSIEQNEWQIVALYRHQTLIKPSNSLVLKPNDIIITIGKPNILMQIYRAINLTSGQFPMPFGKNLYLYLNLELLREEEVLKNVHDAIYLHQILKNKVLYIKITRPAYPKIISKIREISSNNIDIDLQIDFNQTSFKDILTKDLANHDIGMIILSHEIFTFKEAIKNIVNIKIPILKTGKESIKQIRNTAILLNEKVDYEQISPVVFDISAQLETKIKLLNMSPNDENRDNLIDHYQNLSKIFSQNIEIISNQNNPIKEIKKEKNILQVLPFKEKMLEKRIFKFFNSNSDVLSFDMNDHNQLIIPVIEE
jgi:hypothetical protein